MIDTITAIGLALLFAMLGAMVGSVVGAVMRSSQISRLEETAPEHDPDAPTQPLPAVKLDVQDGYIGIDEEDRPWDMH